MVAGGAYFQFDVQGVSRFVSYVLEGTTHVESRTHQGEIHPSAVAEKEPHAGSEGGTLSFVPHWQCTRILIGLNIQTYEE